MVNFDLRKLSAPIEALRPDVIAAYKRLDEKWDAVSKQLKALKIPCEVGYCFDEDPYGAPYYSRLEWRKWKGARRLCIVVYYPETAPDGSMDEQEHVTPYEEWAGEQRIEMLQHVPKLFDCAVEQIKKFIDRTMSEEESK